MTRRSFALLSAAALLVAACGSDDDEATAEPTGTAAAAATGEITVGGPSWTEGAIMMEVYRLLLEDAGFEVTIQPADAREIYAPALRRGEIDVVADYLATMTEWVNREVNGPEAGSVATSDVDSTVAALTELGAEIGLVPLEPAQAANQNAFVVTETFATDNGLTSLSDLAARDEPVVLAATEECPERPFCQIGLEELYGLEIAEVLPLGFGSPQAKQAVVDGEATLGLTGTTDGTLPSFGLVVLEDDKGLQSAENLIPVASEEAAANPALAEALNVLSEGLTTEDLAAMNLAVDQDREKPADVAEAFLTDSGLIG